MDKSQVITLIGVSYTTDSMGQKIATETARNVFCNLSSVTRAEWATAGNMGLKPEYRVTMFEPDYKGEEIAQLVVNGSNKRFGIYRTYISKNENIELYLEKKAGL